MVTGLGVMLNLKSETNSCEKWRFFVIASVSRIKESKHQNFRDHDSNTLVHNYLSKSEFFYYMYTMNEEDAEIRCMERRTVLAGVYLENVPNHSKDDKKFCRCQVGGQNHASRQLGAAAHAI